MPPGDEIQSYLWGVWRLMTGRSDGMQALDLTADGFWNSFFAIVVALPALIVGWVSLANEIAGGSAFGYRFSVVVQLAFVELATWLGPIALFALVVRPAGLAERFVPYIVALNWASALFVWFMLPPSLLVLFWPASADFAGTLSLALLVVTLVLLWRLTNAVIQRGPSVATAVFAGMLMASLVILLSLQSFLGLLPDV